MSSLLRRAEGAPADIGPAAWRLGYRPALDGLRGVAIVLVLGNHAAVPGFVQAGRVGVTMFFVLSGFLITRILLEEREKTGGNDLFRFYWHRAIRLFPALAIMIVAAVPLLAFTPPHVGPSAVLPGILYFSNWVQIGDAADTPVVGHTWSLSVEEQFYLVWPLLLLGILRISRHWTLVGSLLATGAVGLALERAFLWEPTREGFYRTLYGSDTSASALLLGCAIAVVFTVRTFTPSRTILVIGVALLSFIVVTPSIGFTMTIGLAAATLVSGVLIAWASTSSGSVLTWRPLVWAGLLSYALYLWHVPTMHAARFVMGDGPAASAVGLALAFAAAMASRQWIELPARRWRSARTRTSKPATVVVVTDV